jgi:hypothetical protein
LSTYVEVELETGVWLVTSVVDEVEVVVVVNVRTPAEEDSKTMEVAGGSVNLCALVEDVTVDVGPEAAACSALHGVP